MDELYANTEKDIIEKIKTKGICIFENYLNKDKLKIIESEFDNILGANKDRLDVNTGLNRCIRTNMNTKI